MTKTTFAAEDHLENTSTTTQTIHSNSVWDKPDEAPGEMKENHDEIRRGEIRAVLVDGAANAQNERGGEER